MLLADKTQKKLKRLGTVNLRLVPPKIALPLIENATIEDDDDLHSLWANLLASAMNGESEQIEKKFVSVLAELSGDDARNLEMMYRDWQIQKQKPPFKDGRLTYGPSVDGPIMSLTNLNRLGLVSPSYIEFQTYEPGGENLEYGSYGPTRETVRAYGDLSTVELTEFGEAFCRAIMFDKPDVIDQ